MFVAASRKLPRQPGDIAANTDDRPAAAADGRPPAGTATAPGTR